MDEQNEEGARQTIACPIDTTNHYYRAVCKTIFRTSEHRPWCRLCRHFNEGSEAEDGEGSIAGGETIHEE